MTQERRKQIEAMSKVSLDYCETQFEENLVKAVNELLQENHELQKENRESNQKGHWCAVSNVYHNFPGIVCSSCGGMNGSLDLDRIQTIKEANKLLELKKSRDWQPIETAPKNKRIWGYDSIYGSRYIWYGDHNGHDCWMESEGPVRYNPTHWMLFPDPPASKK